MEITPQPDPPKKAYTVTVTEVGAGDTSKESDSGEVTQDAGALKMEQHPGASDTEDEDSGKEEESNRMEGVQDGSKGGNQVKEQT